MWHRIRHFENGCRPSHETDFVTSQNALTSSRYRLAHVEFRQKASQDRNLSTSCVNKLLPVRDKEREHLSLIGYPLFTTLLAEHSLLINIHSDLHYFTGRRSCWQRHRWKHSELTDNKRKHSAIYRRSTSRQKWGWYCSGRRDRHLNNDTNKAVPVATTVVTHCKQCGVGVPAFGTSLEQLNQ